ncbi:MAG: regulatory protein RecX [Lachnospirales bacterium]
MKITDIKEQVKDKNRLSIYIDHKFSFGITKVDAIIYKLKIGDEISKEKYDKIISENVFIKARDKALKLLGLRARSKKEIIDKLKADYNEEVINKVLSVLEKYGYIDDEKFAFAFANDKFKQKGWSNKKIIYELKLKGISQDIINKVLEKSDFDTFSAIKKLLEKRLKGKTKIDFKEKQKQFNYLASKGYEFEEIKEALEDFIKNLD